MGTICARLARSNLQWKLTPTGEAMATFAGFFDGTRKMSQNCNTADRAGVIEGLSNSDPDEGVVRLTSFRRMTNPNGLL
ncbi:putative FMN-binding regulatory protein PaiB [Bradyrhizobium sp. RT4b]